jgi:molecular chaperone DnaJ
MADATHYHILDVSPSASQAEIKRSYRQLVKQFHPDSNRQVDSHDAIARINVAYEVLGDPQRRRTYDRQIGNIPSGRSPRDTPGRDRPRRQRSQAADQHLLDWLHQVYQPIDRILSQVIESLDDQIDDLAADPFDDDLMDAFRDYLEDCRDRLSRAQQVFQSMPNPASVAGAAAHVYYCLSQVSDGVDELDRFTISYSEYYLHTGQELFRIAEGLRREAEAAISDLGVTA